MTINLDIGVIAAWAVALTAIATFGISIIRPIHRLVKAFEGECKRNKYQDKQIAEGMIQKKLLLISLLAVMEGLMEQGCNHNVTKQYTALNDYLNNRPFNTDWYKEEKTNEPK